ncbi:MAG: hypothetical protein V4736_07175, partial [Bdellovibrionota bacterium]
GNDSLKAVTYSYDLELDNAGNIIGGEWYTNKHPDFLYSFNQGTMPWAAYDASASSPWNGMGPVPADWSNAARASSRNAQPLYRILRVMLDSAQ